MSAVCLFRSIDLKAPKAAIPPKAMVIKARRYKEIDQLNGNTAVKRSVARTAKARALIRGASRRESTATAAPQAEQNVGKDFNRKRPRNREWNTIFADERE